jgi:hypothetical protein
VILSASSAASSSRQRFLARRLLGRGGMVILVHARTGGGFDRAENILDRHGRERKQREGREMQTLVSLSYMMRKCGL